MRDLVETETRADAHLDALRIGAGHSVDLARTALNSDDGELVTAATFVMMGFDLPELERKVIEVLARESPTGRHGVRAALRHCDLARISREISRLTEPTSPSYVRAAAIDVLAFHRITIPGTFDELLLDPDLEVRRLAWDAAGRSAAGWAPESFRASLDSEAPAVRTAALHAAARKGEPGLADLCRRAAERTLAPSVEALMMLGVLGDTDDLPLLESRASSSRPDAVAAIASIGAMGSVAAIPMLLEAMSDKSFALVAGRAFVRITGASDIGAALPAPAPIDLNDETIDASDDSPPPDPDKAREWWERERGRFSGHGRWQCGYEISRDPLGEHYDDLTLESRRDVYLGASSRDPIRFRHVELERWVMSVAPGESIPAS